MHSKSQTLHGVSTNWLRTDKLCPKCSLVTNFEQKLTAEPSPLHYDLIVFILNLHWFIVLSHFC